MEVFGDTAELYRGFADDAAGESPCFEEWARAVATDPEVLGWLADLPARKRQPNLVFAAARWHGVPAPGPYDALRSALLEDRRELRRTILTRSTQTNEAGRLATLLPALAAFGEELSLLEVGASAGLCLYPDRYDYRWTTPAGERTLVGSGGPVLTARAEGPVPFPVSRPAVRWRAGIDLAPVDVTDDDQLAWLEQLVWPEQRDRVALLRAAATVTRAEPPRLVAGDLLERLPTLLAEAPGVPVVFHSAVIVYLEPPRRAAFVEMMTDLVSRGACHWVSNEAPDVLPGIDAPDERVPNRFLLCADVRPLAWTHGHGRWLRWL